MSKLDIFSFETSSKPTFRCYFHWYSTNNNEETEYCEKHLRIDAVVVEARVVLYVSRIEEACTLSGPRGMHREGKLKGNEQKIQWNGLLTLQKAARPVCAGFMGCKRVKE